MEGVLDLCDIQLITPYVREVSNSRISRRKQTKDQKTFAPTLSSIEACVAPKMTIALATSRTKRENKNIYTCIYLNHVCWSELGQKKYTLIYSNVYGLMWLSVHQTAS